MANTVGQALRCVIFVAAIGIAQAALATTPEKPATTEESDAICHEDVRIMAGQVETREATEMVGLYPLCWRADEDNGTYEMLADLYAHWSLREYRGIHALPRDYHAENRSALQRLFVGRDLSIVSSIRIDLKNPDMTFVIPLDSISYQGRAGKGQSWATNLVSDDQSLPFFRIGATTSATVKVSAQSTDTLQVEAAGNVIGALKDISALASPGAALVTTLNRNSLQQASKALDNALSAIWSKSRSETHSSARQLSEWYRHASFLVQVQLPDFVRVRSDDGRPLTRWYELTLSCPRYSIFTPLTICEGDDHHRPKITSEMALSKAMRRDVNAPLVTNFQLGSGKTLRQTLAEYDWYGRFLRLGDRQTEPMKVPLFVIEGPSAPLSADTQTMGGERDAAAVTTYAAGGTGIRTPSDYASLCNSIIDALYYVGLSRLDAQIGLWAVVTASPDLVGMEGDFQNNPRCRQSLPFSGVDTNWLVASKDVLIPPQSRTARPSASGRSRRR